MRQLTIEELKQIQLEILDELHGFCTQHGLRYSLIGGTLIGAIRHNGYIPWDDDIDVALPRPDYEWFLKNYHSDTNVLINLMHSELYVETFAKVARKGTLIIDPRLNRRLWGINIDVFPIDGLPGDNTYACFTKVDTLKNRLGVFCPFYKTMTKNRAFWFIKYLLKRLMHFYPHSYLHMKMELEQMLKSNAFEDSPLAGIICGSYGQREIMPKEVFEHYTEKDFEGKKYRIFSMYNEYLTRLFGDYMQFPPVEERVNKHPYNYYLL